MGLNTPSPTHGNLHPDWLSEPVEDGVCAICRQPVTDAERLDEEADLHESCLNTLIAETFASASEARPAPQLGESASRDHA